MVVSPGEREAAWAANTAGALLMKARADAGALRLRLDSAERASQLLEADADDLRSSLARADAEIGALRSQLDSAESRVASLEIQVAAATRSAGDDASPSNRIDELETELSAIRAAVARHAAAERDLRHRLEVAERLASDSPESRMEHEAALATANTRISELEAALTARPDPEAGEEADRLRLQVADLTTRLQAEAQVQRSLRSELATTRAEAERIRQAAEGAREDAGRRIAAAAAEVARQAARLSEFERAAKETDRDAARLVVRNAEIADLEERLAGLASAREAELRQLNYKISSMERVYIEVEAGERRIVELEEEVKALAEARDDAVAALARAERDLVTVQGAHGEAVAMLERLEGVERELARSRTRVVELERHDESGALRGEIERLQRTLVTERERSARMQRRITLETAESARAAPATNYAEWDRLLRERVAAAVESATTPLQERIARLRTVVEEKERLLSTVTAPEQATGPDDLTRIRGIGPKIQEILHAMGITEFRRIARFTDHDVELVGAALPVYGRRILDDRWIEQARELTG